jgi:hypothetical protein
LAPAYPIAGSAALVDNVKKGRVTMDEDRPMPPLVAFAGALGGLAVIRWAYRTAMRVSQELEEARLERAAEAARSREIPTLRRDPNTGAYRPG